MAKTSASVTPAPPAALPATPSPGSSWLSAQSHCPYRQAERLQQALTPDKMPVAFFLGAGCGVAVTNTVGTVTRPLIPNVEGLTKSVCESLKSSKPHSKCSETIINRLCADGMTSPNIEHIFSHIRALHDVIGNGEIDGMNKVSLAEVDAEICKLITTAVDQRLPSHDTPFHQLATWVRSIRRAYPVEIFTSNYDLLIEQAMEEKRVPYFDGFSGSDRTFFDLTSMEQDNLPPRWARLWKVHGSINWWRTLAGDIERRSEMVTGDRQMIYPSHLKYEQSRRMPYLAMLDRLRSFLARGKVVLVTCGYSFSDPHLNDVIIQGLRGNPTAICFALMYGNRTTEAKAVSLARLKVANLTVLAADGAVVGTIEREWKAEINDEHPQHGLAVAEVAAPTTHIECRLGNFAVFGHFLATQLNQLDPAGDTYGV